MSFLKGRNIQIIATSTCFPQQFKVTEIAQIDKQENYIGWEHVCVCEPDLHPSEMAATALRTALSEAERSPDELGFILSIATVGDYPLPWSLATEVGGIVGCSKTCVPIDLNAGCAGLLVALSVLSGWLEEGTQGLAAIVCADRNSSFIERAGAPSQLAGFSDTASALIVATPESALPSLGCFCGSEMLSLPSFNDLKTRVAGGTRFPQAGADGGLYLMLRRLLKLRKDQVCVTGHDYGHSGSDLIIGLDVLKRSNKLHGNTLLLAAADYLFAAGLIRSDREE
jgi:3-oxoacyl-[acyl-carrier-protein] synthase III